jgi:hypothetical protein
MKKYGLILMVAFGVVVLAAICVNYVLNLEQEENIRKNQEEISLSDAVRKNMDIILREDILELREELISAVEEQKRLNLEVEKKLKDFENRADVSYMYDMMHSENDFILKSWAKFKDGKDWAKFPRDVQVNK